MVRPLTRKEIYALLELISAAMSGPEGEGDYQDTDYPAVRRARVKLFAMYQETAK